jgi:hypothetical protein
MEEEVFHFRIGPKGKDTTTAFEDNIARRFPLPRSLSDFIAQFPEEVDFSTGHVISVCLGGHIYSPVFDKISYAKTRSLIQQTVGLVHPDGSGEPKTFACALFKREVADATPPQEA